MTTINTYISAAEYIRAPSGHDLTTLINNSTLLSSQVSAGATALNVSPALTAGQKVGDRVAIFDGSNTEFVTVNAAVPIGATSLTVTATANAHAANTSICTDGTQGSLADMIVNASAQIEAFCRQSLLQATYSAERLHLRTTRAAVTRDFELALRPKHFPVQSVSAVTARLASGISLNFDVSQVFIDADAQLVTLAQMTSTSGSLTFWGNIAPPIRQTTPGWIDVSYVAGYAYAALPFDVKQAAIWLVSDLLSDRRNPTGAAEQQLGKEHIVTRLRGDTSGKSVLTLRAEANLIRYAQRAF